jgi:hypothetical protein
MDYVKARVGPELVFSRSSQPLKWDFSLSLASVSYLPRVGTDRQGPVQKREPVLWGRYSFGDMVRAKQCLISKCPA